MTEPLLRVEEITVSFEGFKALDRVSLAVMPRTIQVIIGPNGAGKSTLMDAIIGRVKPMSGRVILNGTDITNLAEYEVVRRGICRKFQTPGILSGLTVEENIIVAAKQRRDWLGTFKTSISAVERSRVEELLDLIMLSTKRDMLAAHLAHGAKQWLEIGMVVASNGDLLLLDEPAAGMSHHERFKTAELIRSLSQRHAFIVIDHDMDFVEQLGAPVSILHMGRVLRQGSIDEVRSDPEVKAVYLGRAEESRVA